MKAFKSVGLIVAVVGTMMFVASPPAQSNPGGSMQAAVACSPKCDPAVMRV